MAHNREVREPTNRPMEPMRPESQAASLPIMSVGELTGLVKSTLRSAPRLRDVWVEGEVGQVSISAAGHCYFTLKDERAQLRCVIFRDDRLMMPFEARTGLRLVANGSLDVFEPQGTYQLYVRSLQPSGFGDLALQFEALKAKLAAEGLFEASRKRPLPPMPLNIGVVTSLSGAVLHDIRRVLARRWPLARVVVSACQVQGQGAAPTIVAAMRRVARWTDDETGACDGRGHPRPRRRLARGSVAVQRRGRRPRDRGTSVSGRRRRRPRDGRDAGRVRRRRASRDAVRGGGADRPVARR